MSVKETLENICDVAEEMASMLPDDPESGDITEELYDKLCSKGAELQRYSNALKV